MAVHLSGLSGLDLQQELTKANIEIPIIFITGRGDIPICVRALKAGALEFLTKPFDHKIFWTRSNRELPATAERGMDVAMFRCTALKRSSVTAPFLKRC